MRTSCITKVNYFTHVNIAPSQLFSPKQLLNLTKTEVTIFEHVNIRILHIKLAYMMSDRQYIKDS